MDYRLLNQETLPQAMELWDACFEKKGTPFYEWYFSSYCLKQNKVLGAFRDGRLAAMLHLNPYTLHVRGRDWRVPYIVGVATDPLDRGRHLMGELMDKAFTMLRAMQIPFVILMPIHAGIYQPYGFAYTHMRKRYELPLSSLSFGEAALADYQLDRVPTLLAKDAIAPVYAEAMGRYHGYAVRGDREWENILVTAQQDHMETVIVKDGSDILGYVLYNREGETVNVQELLSLSAPSRLCLLRYLRGFAGTYRTLRWLAEPDDLTYLRLADQHEAPAVAPFMMGRVVSAALLLEQLPVPEALAGEQLVLALRDDQVPLNTMLVKLSFTEKGIRLLNTIDDPEVIMDIRAFTQLVFGTMSTESLQRAGFVLTRDEGTARKLDLLFPVQVNYINEYF